MKKSFFSVIMPVYKVEKYITKAIESVLNQGFSDFQLIIVNDGSPDTSMQIAKKYAAKDARILLLEKENGGLSDARNFAMEYANGHYLYFLDSDDWIEDTLLEKLYHKIKLNPAEIYVFGYYLDMEDAQGNLLKRQQVHSSNYTFHKGITPAPKLTPTLMGLLGYAWNKVYSKDFIDSHNFRFDKGISLVEDILFNSKIYQKANTVILIQECLYHYISREVPTLIKSYHPNAFKLILKKHRALEAFLPNWGYDQKKIDKTLASNLVLGIQYCINNLLYYKSELSPSLKKKAINEILQHSETKKYIDYFKPKTKNDQLYKKLIKYRLSTVIMYIKSWKKAA